MVTEHEPMKKVDNLDYLYEITYTNMDWDEAKKWFRANNSPRADAKESWKGRGFGCSSVRAGYLVGRNFDFFYNESADVIVHTEYDKSNAHYNSVGIASCNPDFNSHRMDNLSNEEYAILPFALIDGINENGVACNVNVIPARDFYPQTEEGDAAWSNRVIDINPGEPELYYQFMVRFVLDNATSAKNAVDLLKQQNIVNHIDGVHVDYDGIENGGMELHLMISDVHDTFIVEIVPDNDGGNHLLIMSNQDHSGSKLVPIMTNYYRTVGGFDTFGVSPHAVGIERFKILKSGLSDMAKQTHAPSVEDMVKLMEQVKYSACYSSDTELEKYWFSDLSCGKFNYDFEYAVDYFKSHPEKAEELRNYMDAEKKCIEDKDRQRGSAAPWITVHTNVFNFWDNTMHLWVQEDYEHKIGEFTVKPKETSK